MTALHRLSLAVLSGALLILSFPGTGDQAWLAFVALGPLLVALPDIPWSQAAILGSVTGLVFWFGTLSWVAPTMVRYGGVPWSVAALVLAGLAGYLALYQGVFCALLARASLRAAPVYVVGSASLWVALEFLRTYLLTGFPWNLLGSSQYRNLLVIQVAALTGVYGVSFLVVAVNAALARIVRCSWRWGELAASAVTATALVGLAVWIPGVVSSGRVTTSAIPVALIQGNIDQGAKWDPGLQEATIEAYRRLTLDAGQGHPELVIWPETAVPFFLRDDARRAAIEALARHVGADLLVGAPDREGGGRRNSAFLMGREGRLLDRYDKRHLVPFGEYVPLKRLLFFVTALAGGAIGEFTPGRDATLLPTSRGRLGVVICFEAIQTSLWAAVNEGGTGSAAAVPGLAVSGKTGTAQTVSDGESSKGQNHAWFAGYAPVEDPKVVVVVLVERGGAGGKVAAPLARQILLEILPSLTGGAGDRPA